MENQGRFPVMIGAIQEDNGVIRAFCEIKLTERVEPLVMISLRSFTTVSDCEFYIENEVAPNFPNEMDTIIPHLDGEFKNGFSIKNAKKVATMVSGVFGFAIDPDEKDFGIHHAQPFQQALIDPSKTVFIIDSAYNEHLDKYAPLLQMISSTFETTLVCEEVLAKTHEELVEHLNGFHSDLNILFNKHPRPTGDYSKELRELILKQKWVSVSMNIKKPEVKNESKQVH